jgi:ATP adenylyltransferase/5',5'''-P-1,P-4-tetraphosphate phosphorylase II
MITDMYIGSYMSRFNYSLFTDKDIITYLLRIISEITRKYKQEEREGEMTRPFMNNNKSQTMILLSTHFR